MRIVLAGLGSIGRRHLANLRQLEPAADITLLRHRQAEKAPPDAADRVVYTLADALAQQPELALLCGPTQTHAPLGIAFANAGAHLFVEKPLALDTASASALLGACERQARLLIVGYNLRFSPSLRALRDAARSGRIGRIMSGRAEVGQYLPDWRPGVDYRTTNSARAEFGGGVVLELSHEIDYMRAIFGEVAAVNALVARLGDLEIDVDDTAELLLSFTSGSMASIHLDMTQRSAIRQCRLVGTHGTLTWDGLRGETRAFDCATGWTTLAHAGDADRNAMYVAELAHALACVRGQAVPEVDGRGGARVVEIAEALARAAREGRRLAV